MSSTASPSSDPRVIEVLPARVRLGKPGPGTPRPDEPGQGTPGPGHGDRQPPRATVSTGEVGDFRQGDPASRWALARYLVARTIGDGAVRAVLAVAIGLGVLTVALAFLSAPAVLTVLVGLMTIGWFVAWRIARALWGRLTGGPALEPVRHELDKLVGETRPDVRRELRRHGLPAHPFAAFAFAFRLVGRRRAETTARMREFDVERVVPAGRVDEVYLLLERVQPTA